MNLHALLPSDFATSTATGVYHTGSQTYVVGYGYNNTTQRTEALLWTSQAGQPACGSADFNHDGDTATDADIEAFFRCIGGSCCATCDSADFNGDGDSATDADIEAFFRVLAGGTC